MQKLLEEGRAVRGTKVLKSNYKLKAGDEIVVTLPEPQPLDVQPENIPLDIIYEDEDVVVVNKPRGMVVHPAAGNYSGTLVNALLYHCLFFFAKFWIQCPENNVLYHIIILFMNYLIISCPGKTMHIHTSRPRLRALRSKCLSRQTAAATPQRLLSATDSLAIS